MNNTYFTSSLLYCFDPAIGPTGLAESEFQRALTLGLTHAERWRDQRNHPLFQSAGHQALDPNFDAAFDVLSRFKTIFILGTGGSSLGGQTLAVLAQPGTPHLIFLDNIDPVTIQHQFKNADWPTTGLLVISKSGETIETAFQCWAALSYLKQHTLPLDQHIVLITEPKPSTLRQFGQEHDLIMLDHDTGIGGRYSVLSNVGLLPASLMGLDLWALKQGSAAEIEALFTHNNLADLPALQGAAMHHLFMQRGINQTVLMPYVDALKPFSAWYCQLTAESLGKQGKGLTPLRALGPVDQHSQLQLYLDGPRDKIFTIIMTDTEKSGDALTGDLPPSLIPFRGKTIGDLCAAEAKATVETLAKNGCPTRTITLPHINEESLGGLLMHFMLETMLIADYMGINAFDQPAVEEGKILAKKYLLAA